MTRDGCHLVTKPIEQLKSREEMGGVLQGEWQTMRVGVEVGVQSGAYTEVLLKRWTNCHRFYLVSGDGVIMVGGNQPPLLPLLPLVPAGCCISITTIIAIS